jgi:prepilin-type N-terminal cleavage/methylation domain-containing protein
MERNIVVGNLKVQSQRGFSLLELMIAMFIMIILLSVALPTYQRSVQHARETVLRENLWQMRRAIDQYAADKGKFPPSLKALVKEEYLRQMPIDPITEKADAWVPVEVENTNSPDGERVLKDVKSGAEGEDSSKPPIAYKDY